MKTRTILLSAAVALGCASALAAHPIQPEGGRQGGMADRTIAIWQSHGRYFDQKENRWKWQRCRLYGTVEDLYTRSYVVPFLVPMLENAGAYVVMPRERDDHHEEIIVDEEGIRYHNGKEKWKQMHHAAYAKPHGPLGDGQNPFITGKAMHCKSVQDKDKASTAEWCAPVPVTGELAVYVTYPQDKDNCPAVTYTIHTAAGPKNFTIDQTKGGGTWLFLGMFPFKASSTAVPLVSVTNYSPDKGEVVADAIRLGGGMGSVARKPNGAKGEGQTSGMPRWAEGARYWLQSAGFPEKVYAPAKEEGDYRDDIYNRPTWANYLRDEQGIPVDMVMAFHSDAGNEPGNTIVGTLGIYYTNNGAKFSDGRSRNLNEKLASSIVNSVVNDIRAKYNSNWVKRPMRDKSYIEARVTDMPSMLLELLSHQNFADMKLGLNPQFKHDVSRAVYKGILKYMSQQGLAKYVVTPLAPGNFSVSETEKEGIYRLAWTPTRDPLEPTAETQSYIVEERRGKSADAPFIAVATVTEPTYDAKLAPNETASWRIVAVNEGGRSFPSEVLAAGFRKGAPCVTVVNGFTRVSGPEPFEGTSNQAGFGLSDPGVPWNYDLSYTGAQHNFTRSDEWVDDDNPGFGASYADMETKPVYGNTFDFALVHGNAIMNAGCSFVSSSVDAFANDSLTYTPECIDLILGLQKPPFTLFPTNLRGRLEVLGKAGVPIFVSGANIGSGLKDKAEKDFARQTLGIKLRTDKAVRLGEVKEVQSTYSNDFKGGTFDFNTELGGKPYAVTEPDAIVPDASGAATIMRYKESDSSAGVAYRSGSRAAVSLGFPFEAITDASSRNALMNQILDFLKL